MTALETKDPRRDILDFSPSPPIWNLLDLCLFQKMNGLMWRWNKGVVEREANGVVLTASSSSSVSESSSAKWRWKYRPRMLRDQHISIYVKILHKS
nr:hypothetical protein Iba_chr05fCG4410 [Ipomoea batatas]